MSESNAGLMTIFAEALELPDPAARAAYLDRACGGDANLRGRVEALLAAHAGAGHFLEPGVSEDPTHLPTGATAAYEPQPQPLTEQLTGADHPDTSADAPPAGPVAEPAPSTVIAGRYTLVEVIGEGGMGSVYLAGQTDPVKRQVALKLIKGGADSKAVLARFDAERQALALMDHPNIARVFDGGTTEQGQPFFVMELVNGVPLTEYCDRKRLPLKARLELFVSVCQAVQHAHQKGIIHRDLKPSNVLVTEVDGRPTPKVIDFGVAKATEVRLTDLSYADTGAIVGTPAYMSPEQADPSSMDIDTRTDVYALGVMLYELLVGSPPLDARQFKRGAILEMLRMVREVDPPRPSTKLSAAADLPNIAANRDIEPAKLARSLRGELDWVVMKALEKDRTRRYETANAFAHDLQRYLADEVVEARPPSRGYRLKKFVRRHKGQVIAVSLVFFALLAGMAGTTWGLFKAREQEQIARDETAEKDKARLAEIEQRNLAVGRADDLKYQLGVSSMVLASAAYDNRDVSLSAERLDKVPEEQRGWEWRYLKQQTRGGLFTLYGHTEAVVSVAFSPDGERIVTESGHINRRDEPCEVKVWDARTGTAVFQLNYLRQPGVTQLFSLGGTRLATAGSQDNTARLWDARTGKLQRELKHTSPVGRVLLSPDGSRVATVCGDGMVRVWDADTGKPQWEFKGTRTIVAFSPDSTRLFIGPVEKQKALLCDAGTGKALLELSGCNSIRGVSFSPDGTRIVIGGIGQATVWDAEKGGPPLFALKRLNAKGLRDWTSCVAFGPDGARILTGGGMNEEERALVWDARTATTLFSLKGRPGPKTEMYFQIGVGDGEQSAAFSPDGTRIVTVGGQSGAHEATVWDARTGAELLTLTGHTNQVLCAAFSPDGTSIVTGCKDGTAKVWDARTGAPRLEMNGHRGELHTLAVSPDGKRIISGGGEPEKPGAATVWDARTGLALLELRGLRGTVMSAAFSRDGRIITGGAIQTGRDEQGFPIWAGEAKVWDAQTGQALLELKGFKEGVNSIAISPDGTRIITGGGEPGQDGDKSELKVWDARSGAVLLDLTKESEGGGILGHTGASVAFSPDGTRFVVGGLKWKGVEANWATTVRDTATGASLLELKGHTGIIQCVAFSPDGTRIVTGGGEQDRRALVWDATTGAVLLELKGHTSAVLCVAFSPDGKRIVTGSVDRTVRVWDAKTGTALVELKGFTERVTSVAFSPDGKRLVTGERGGAVTVWDVRPVKSPLILQGHTGLIGPTAFSPDGTRIVTGSYDKTAKVWDTRTGAVLLDLKGHENNVWSVAFSPDGKRIVSGSGSGDPGSPGEVKVWDARTGTPQRELKWDAQTAKVWDARTGAALLELKGPPGTLMMVSLSPDGTRLVTSNFNGKKTVWDAETGKELPGEAIPNTRVKERTSPDGRLFAHVDRERGTLVELIPLQPDEEELAYRRLHAQPNVARYREGYLAARAAKDDFAATFYLNLIPPDERKELEAIQAADKKPQKWPGNDRGIGVRRRPRR
jgi:WD40 repeat protein